jgi:hypothetical protein
VSSKREQILNALHVVAQSVEPAILRNAPLGDLDADSGRFATIRDGDLELVDQYLNAPGAIYEFTATPNLIIVVQKGVSPDAIDTILDGRIEAFVAAFEAVTDLGGLISAIRVLDADFAPRELFGTDDKKGAELVIEVDFWSARRSG